MYPCLCGKSFGHASSLSRHQRGNVKSKIKPCEAFQTLQEEKREANRTMFMEAQRRRQGEAGPLVEVLDHDPRALPDFVKGNGLRSFLPDPDLAVDKRLKCNTLEDTGRTLTNILLRNFPEIYMNEGHPEYWNIVLQNISSMEMKVRRGGTWILEPFKDWAHKFTQQFFVAYLRETEKEEDYYTLLSYVLRVLDEDHVMSEICGGLKRALTNHYMRMTIKEQYNFK